MLDLLDVTLTTAFSVAHELHLMAADECLKHARFGDIKVYSDGGAFGRDYVTEAPKFSNEEELQYLYYHEMPKQITTSHLLMIQWDSWIVNPGAWRKEFLDYDYIGAPWTYNDGYNVGNSGFCLRSKRLMEFIASHKEEFPIGYPEDHVLCREYQKRLPQFKWAPAELAWHFSVEYTTLYPESEMFGLGSGKVFGFHGTFLMFRILRGEARKKLLNLAYKDPYIMSKPELKEICERNGLVHV